MNFYIWFTIAIVVLIMVVPVILATAWKIASILVVALVAAIMFGLWKLKRSNRSHF